MYLVAVLGIGLWSRSRTRTARDFFIAGQGVGLLVTGLAIMSSAFSGFVFIGGPGLTYRMGLVSLFICVPAGFTSGLLCWSVGRRLRSLSGIRDVLTVPDAIGLRFRSRWASGLAAGAVVMGTVGYLGVQLQALGLIFEAVFGTREWGAPLAITAGIVILVFYGVAGGMVAGVYTDLVQGGIMVLASVTLFSQILSRGGGLGGMARSIAASDLFGPEFLDPLGGAPLLTAVGFFLVFSVGTLGQPHMLHKFYMLDDPRKMRWIPLVVGSTQAMCLLVWIGLGFAVPALVANGVMLPLSNPDTAAPGYLLQFVSPALAGLLLTGVLAAIMSTADSFLNIGSAALVRDIPRAVGLAVENELRWGRRAVVALALAAGLLAVFYRDLIALLGTFAFGTFGAALAPTLAVGLCWRRVTGAAAVSSIATGLVLNVGLELFRRGQPASTVFATRGVPPAALAMAASFVVLFVVTALTRVPQEREPHPDILAALEL